MGNPNLFLEILLALLCMVVIFTLFDNARRKHRSDTHK
jgi:hypothetical protein